MKNYYFTLILKDYRPLKLIFFILTSYLLIDELRIFLYVKPTLTSVSQTNLTPHNFPEILLCPLPSYNQSALSEVGYADSYWYSYGLPLNNSFRKERSTRGLRFRYYCRQLSYIIQTQLKAPKSPC